MEKNLDKEVVHDTRGRKIISVAKAKRELISAYIISLIITSMIRMLVGYFISPDINVDKVSMDNFIGPAVFYGILDLIMFMATWWVTYKFFMNKFTIRGVEKIAYKSTMVMINIVVCIYISVSMVTDVRDTIVEMENKYEQLMSLYNMYSSYSDLYTDEVIDAKELVDSSLEEFKDTLYMIMFVKMALAICGNFIGWSMVKRDVENMGLSEEEYRMCLNIEENDRSYTTNVVPVNKVEKEYEPEMNDFTTLDNLR